MIRAATTADCPTIAAIWNEVIRDSLITFTFIEKSAEGLATLIAERAALGQAFLVAEISDQIAGFATYGAFRAGPGYAQTVEHTVILAPDARGRGLGRALMTALEDHARQGGAHVMIAAVSGENPEGRAFHAALGFRDMAVLPEVGRKDGRWLDLVLMHKRL